MHATEPDDTEAAETKLHALEPVESGLEDTDKRPRVRPPLDHTLEPALQEQPLPNSQDILPIQQWTPPMSDPYRPALFRSTDTSIDLQETWYLPEIPPKPPSLWSRFKAMVLGSRKRPPKRS